MLGREALRVAVFIDYENARKHAEKAFGTELGTAWSPFLLARHLAAARGRGEAATLERVEVHRGVPGHGAWARRTHALARRWCAEAPCVRVHLRPMAERDGRQREQGVDLALAISAVTTVLDRRCDLAVVFSHDADLAPVLEALVQRGRGSCVETGSWRAPEHLAAMARTTPGTKKNVANVAVGPDVFRTLVHADGSDADGAP